MIEINDQNYISICNWEKHQNVDAMDKIRKIHAKELLNIGKNKRLYSFLSLVTLQVTLQ